MGGYLAGLSKKKNKICYSLIIKLVRIRPGNNRNDYSPEELTFLMNDGKTKFHKSEGLKRNIEDKIWNFVPYISH